ncbi:MAG: ATP-dependent zinc metalloprotease FtsH [Bacteroides sp.]|nr:ATP-dependent zinc metalloprotease FtsH [Bacteroides sp.]MCM1548347.1 ATP-dependent zinc metalloprotease FtsH [Clostridium sp.]
MNENNSDNNKKPNGSWKPLVVMLIISVALTLLFWGTLQRYKQGTVEEIKYSEFMDMLENDEIKSIEISDSLITIHPIEEKEGLGLQKVTYTTVRVYDIYLVDKLEEAGVEYGEIRDNSNAWWVNILQFLLMLGVIYLVMTLFMRLVAKNGMMGGVGRSKAKVYVEKKTGVTFADVAGQEEAKESLVEMVDFLHNPKKYLEIGAKLPKGALLVGPPGTGKTLLAKAVAGEANVPFFSLSGSDFVEMYVGVGASRVRDLFKDANAMAPCIIFIDEIDAIGRSRDTAGHGGDSEREQTLNQLLAEMDGFDTSKGIVILAATNRPEVLDKALLRPGRFDRRVIVEKPDLKGRVDTLKVHSKDVKMDETVDFDELALATSGAVGADLANIINEAALAAVKAGRQYVSQKDLFESVEVVFAGKEKKDRILSEKEKKIVSYHEIGHALIIALQKHTEPVQKITIIPRTMGALGYVMQVPEEEKYLSTKAEMLADLVTALGGRAAEAIKFDSVTTGASNDIEQATAKARAMITLYGMSDTFGMVALESTQNRYLDGRRVLNCSEETATKIDEEISRMLKDAYEQAYALLKENEALMDKLAEYLIQKETITGKEFMEIFNREKGILPEADTAQESENSVDGKEAEGRAEAHSDVEGAEGSKAPEQHGPWEF